jgi:hypothetical protein
MDFLTWLALAGGLLLVMALSAAYLRRLPVTSAGVYFTVGLAVSPLWLDFIRIDFRRESGIFEHLTEIAATCSRRSFPLATPPSDSWK